MWPWRRRTPAAPAAPEPESRGTAGTTPAWRTLPGLSGPASLHPTVDSTAFGAGLTARATPGLVLQPPAHQSGATPGGQVHGLAVGVARSPTAATPSLVSTRSGGSRPRRGPVQRESVTTDQQPGGGGAETTPLGPVAVDEASPVDAPAAAAPVRLDAPAPTPGQPVPAMPAEAARQPASTSAPSRWWRAVHRSVEAPTPARVQPAAVRPAEGPARVTAGRPSAARTPDPATPPVVAAPVQTRTPVRPAAAVPAPSSGLRSDASSAPSAATHAVAVARTSPEQMASTTPAQGTHGAPEFDSSSAGVPVLSAPEPGPAPAAPVPSAYRAVPVHRSVDAAGPAQAAATVRPLAGLGRPLRRSTATGAVDPRPSELAQRPDFGVEQPTTASAGAATPDATAEEPDAASTSAAEPLGTVLASATPATGPGPARPVTPLTVARADVVAPTTPPVRPLGAAHAHQQPAAGVAPARTIVARSDPARSDPAGSDRFSAEGPPLSRTRSGDGRPDRSRRGLGAVARHAAPGAPDVVTPSSPQAPHRLGPASPPLGTVAATAPEADRPVTIARSTPSTSGSVTPGHITPGHTTPAHITPGPLTPELLTPGPAASATALLASGIVHREADGSVMFAAPVGGEPPAPAPATTAGSGVTVAPTAPAPDLNALAEDLYDLLERRLRADLLAERERIGSLAD